MKGPYSNWSEWYITYSTWSLVSFFWWLYYGAGVCSDDVVVCWLICHCRQDHELLTVFSTTTCFIGMEFAKNVLTDIS